MTAPRTKDHLGWRDPLVALSNSSVLEAGARRAVVMQPPARKLDNYLGVRHAGMLFAVGYEASRALLAAALEDYAGLDEVRLLDSEVAYEKPAVGPVTATAEPATEDWDLLRSQIGDGQAARLPIAVTLRNDDGQTVSAMSVCWQIIPARRGDSQ